MCCPVPHPSVLVADDDPCSRELLAWLFVQRGARVVTVPDGRAALERCRTECFDLLVLDHVMPNHTGLEVILELSASGTCPPAVIVTTGVIETLVGEAREAGVLDILPKPLSDEDAARILSLARRLSPASR